MGSLKSNTRSSNLQCACAGFGCIPATYMFVGISAGRLGGLKTGVPFTRDASGRILQRFLKEVGLSSTDEFAEKPNLIDCYITNLVKGEILDQSGMNRSPTNEEILPWLPVLRQEVEDVAPKIIIALGKIVFDYIREMFPDRVRVVRHPRWYQAHGALSDESPAYIRMVNDYRESIGIEFDFY